jgi:hypothetical protein
MPSPGPDGMSAAIIAGVLESGRVPGSGSP